jgi:hypothetical protein
MTYKEPSKGPNLSKPLHLKSHGYIGILLIFLAEITLILQYRYPIAKEISIWTTPICWWGYIMLTDAIIHKIKGESMMVNHLKGFIEMLFLSIIFWLIFEVYNLCLINWKYIGLPKNPLVTALGMALSFVTIMPGMFFTAEIIEITGVFKRIKIARLKVSNRMIYSSIWIGLVFLIVPLLVKQVYARYLFAFIWMGFVFLLEPINYSSHTESLLRDLEKGELHRILSLFMAGLICGLLWEFWNYWAATKWVYMAPFTSNLRIFEIPIAGFLGFGPFAWEFFSMYYFVRLFRFKRD